jgi:hypothetical protein
LFILWKENLNIDGQQFHQANHHLSPESIKHKQKTINMTLEI